MKISGIVVAVCALLGMNLRAEPLEVGAKAPDVTVPDENGTPVDLAAICGEGVTLVYFYPKADTPGCTSQACSLRDSIADLEGLGVRVIGVSRDTSAAQKAFKEKYQLPFTLLADSEGTVIEAFGVPTLPMGMAKRQSFLFKDGAVVWRSLNAQTGGHAQEVKDAIAQLK